MTRRFYVDGVEQTDTSARLVGPVEGLTCAADGSYATSRWAVRDRTGSLSYGQLQQWAVEEDTAADPRLFTGLTYGIMVTRGPFRVGAKREYGFEVDDLNAYLHMDTMPAATGKRQAESFATRIAWFLTTPGMAGVVFDNGLVASRPGFMYDESDYRKSYHDDVLQDMARGWIFFLYWDASAAPGEEISLFFDLPTSAVHTSTLSISSVAADCGRIDDPATTVYPVAADPEPTLTRSGAQMYCKVDYTFIGGQNIVRHNATTHTLLFGSNPNLHRTAVISTDKVGHLATAEAQCALFLANHATQIDEITCRVKVPSDKVTLINAGMWLPIRFAQFPDYSGTGGGSRITRKTLPRMESTNGYDDIDLTLSTRGASAISGGDPGDFPHVTSCAPTSGSVVQVSIGTVLSGTWFAVMAAPVTIGNTLVRYAPKRDAPTGPATPTFGEWIETPPGLFTNLGNDGAKCWYRPVLPADTDHVDIDPNINSNDVVIELEGSLTLVDSDNGSGSGVAGTPVTTPAVTPTTGSPAAILGFVNGFLGPGTAFGDLYTPAAGWTQLADVSDGAGHPNSVVLYKHVTSASGSYTPEATAVYDGTWVTQSLAFVCDAANSPPSPGTWVFGEVVTMSTVGGVSTGATAFVWAAGSLRVKVDGVTISPASYVDTGAALTPATGDFALTWELDGDETVTVDYQGI